MKSTLVRWGAAALMVGLLVGCGGGGGGSNDTAAAAPGAGAGAGATPPAATTTIATAVALPANDTATAPTAAFTVVQNAGIAPVTVNSPPKVNFTVISDGAVVKGLTTSNARFVMAKLVPGANGAPDQWVSYVSRTETATPTVGPGGKAALTSAAQAIYDPAASAAQLVYNDAGYYTYTFTTDIKDSSKTNGVTYEPTRTHRVVIWLNYVNKAGQTVQVNPYFDFTIDASGNAVAVTDASKGHKVVDISSCNECHGKLQLHGGNAADTQACVACHNSGLTDANSGNVLDLRVMVHRIHAGEHGKELFGMTYAIWGYHDTKSDFSEVTYPQPLTNCTKCHDGSKKDAAGNQLAAQGDNWKNVPSRAACGSCHAGIDFAKGTGATIANAEADLAAGNPVGTTRSGHVGGAKANDSQCLLCHDATTIPTYHVTVDPTGSVDRGGYPVNTADNVPTPGILKGMGPAIPLAAQMNLPSGVYKLNYEIKKVTVAANQATVVYRILLDGKPLILNTAAGSKLKDDLDGSPGIYVGYATTQDGITSPADWNGFKNASVIALRDGTGGNPKQTGPDADGFYTATLGAALPADAKLVTAAIGVDYQAFVQLGLAAYPKGIRLREPKFVMKLADGYSSRRSIVSADKCNNCHGQLGVQPSFHSGARNNGEGCAFCHDPNRATGHGGGWSVQAKIMVHGIHGGSKRTNDYSVYATAANPRSFGTVTYPGVLKNCETCHVSGSYDFSGSANAAAVPNLLWTTDAKYDETKTGDIGLSPWMALLGKGKADYRTPSTAAPLVLGNLVSSPIASACFGCHDSSLATQHMQSNGGTLYALFSSVSSVATRPAIGTASTMTFTKSEQCTLCHLAGKVADIKAMHVK